MGFSLDRHMNKTIFDTYVDTSCYLARGVGWGGSVDGSLTVVGDDVRLEHRRHEELGEVEERNGARVQAPLELTVGDRRHSIWFVEQRGIKGRRIQVALR